MILFIFVRRGCCLCDELKKELKAIDVKTINSDLQLKEIDIDRFDLYQNKFKKYDYEVPVIGFRKDVSSSIIELPRVSPRLNNLQLKNWLQKNIDFLI
tara:strand:+ start:416 stop:709 length:294 start_codon:yes stop_codon:yes gene_type:complete